MMKNSVQQKQTRDKDNSALYAGLIIGTIILLCVFMQSNGMIIQ
jgi:hypothetical protein